MVSDAAVNRSIVDQVTQFHDILAAKPAGAEWQSSNSLFAIWIGINDVVRQEPQGAPNTADFYCAGEFLCLGIFFCNSLSGSSHLHSQDNVTSLPEFYTILMDRLFSQVNFIPCDIHHHGLKLLCPG